MCNFDGFIVYLCTCQLFCKCCGTVAVLEDVCKCGGAMCKSCIHIDQVLSDCCVCVSVACTLQLMVRVVLDVS